ncbi:hypothetical protein TNCV_3496201 [Trichonephila clavipes]|nr:hypothetical protein TNCV_3496201 [Trichonephila clavipes]
MIIAVRMQENLSGKDHRYRPRGRTPLKWFDYVRKDLNTSKSKNWKTIAKSSRLEKTCGEGEGPHRAVELLKKNNHLNVLQLGFS